MMTPSTGQPVKVTVPVAQAHASPDPWQMLLRVGCCHVARGYGCLSTLTWARGWPSKEALGISSGCKRSSGSGILGLGTVCQREAPESLKTLGFYWAPI